MGWAVTTWAATAAVAYFVTSTALDLARPLWGLPLSVGGDAHQLALRMIVLLGMLGPPVVVAVAAGMLARWWHAVLACQAAGAVSVAAAVGLAPNKVGFGLALVAAASWVAGAAVGGVVCGVRRWRTARNWTGLGEPGASGETSATSAEGIGELRRTT
jgi:hypothetical protein